VSAWPLELVFRRSARSLHISFDNGEAYTVPFSTLRAESPSAEVQGHGPHQKRTVPNVEAANVVGAEPVGRYAVRLIFADGHNSGLYTWDWLKKLGEMSR
jgi:DUF971 family protein